MTTDSSPPAAPARSAELSDLGRAETESDVEAQRVRARVRQELFGGAPEPVRVAHFEILGRLGEGAMGAVYEARDTELDRVVALKLLHPELRGGGQAATSSLLQEARAMAKLKHPNVVTVHQVGTHGAQVYVAMERARTTLREWLARERPPSERVLELVIQAGQGLAAVHRAGLVHRDFKPDNVLVDDSGAAQVSDFGLALRGDEEAASLRAGTPAYMAPEQLRGEGADALSDQFAFAVSAVELLSGERPFTGDSVQELLDAIVRRVDGATLQAGLPQGTGEVFARALEAEPSKRHASMDVLLTRLESATRVDRVGAASSSGGRKSWLLPAGVALVLAAGVGYALTRRSAPVVRGRTSSLPTPASASAAPPPTTDVTRLCVKAVRASSAKAEHPANHAFDGVPATAWTEAAPGDGAGQWLEVELKPGTFIESVQVSGGWAVTTGTGADLWQLNSTLKTARVSWDGGEASVSFERSKDRGVKKMVEVGAQTSTLRLTAVEVARGRFRDLCIDEVVLRGRCP